MPLSVGRKMNAKPQSLIAVFGRRRCVLDAQPQATMELSDPFVSLVAVAMLGVVIGHLLPDAWLWLPPFQVQSAGLPAPALRFIQRNEGMLVLQFEQDLSLDLRVVAEVNIFVHALADGTRQPQFQCLLQGVALMSGRLFAVCGSLDEISHPVELFDGRPAAEHRLLSIDAPRVMTEQARLVDV